MRAPRAVRHHLDRGADEPRRRGRARRDRARGRADRRGHRRARPEPGDLQAAAAARTRSRYCQIDACRLARRQRGDRRPAAGRQVRRARLPARRRRRAVRARPAPRRVRLRRARRRARRTASWSTSTTCTSTSSTRAWSSAAATGCRRVRATARDAPRVDRAYLFPHGPEWAEAGRRPPARCRASDGDGDARTARARLLRRAGHAARPRHGAARRAVRAGRRRGARATCDAAWELGVRFFDTAPHYGAGLSERRLGDALRERPRDELRPLHQGRPAAAAPDAARGTPSVHRATPACGAVWDFSRDGVRRSLEESLERLGARPASTSLLVHDADDHLDDGDRRGVPGARRAARRGRHPGDRRGHERGGAARADRARGGRRLRAARRPAHAARPERGRGAAAAVPRARRRRDRGRRVQQRHPRRPGPDAHHDYAPAPPEIHRRVAEIGAVCERHGVPLRVGRARAPAAAPRRRAPCWWARARPTRCGRTSTGSGPTSRTSCGATSWPRACSPRRPRPCDDRRRAPPPVGSGAARVPVDDRPRRAAAPALRARRAARRRPARPASPPPSPCRRRWRRRRPWTCSSAARASGGLIAGVVGWVDLTARGRGRPPRRPARAAGRRAAGRHPPPGPRRARPGVARPRGRPARPGGRGAGRAPVRPAALSARTCRPRRASQRRCPSSPSCSTTPPSRRSPPVAGSRGARTSPRWRRTSRFTQALRARHGGALGPLARGRHRALRRPAARAVRAGAADGRLGLAGLHARRLLRRGARAGAGRARWAGRTRARRRAGRHRDARLRPARSEPAAGRPAAQRPPAPVVPSRRRRAPGSTWSTETAFAPGRSDAGRTIAPYSIRRPDG